jgi:hypothetical protein
MKGVKKKNLQKPLAPKHEFCIIFHLIMFSHFCESGFGFFIFF